jgi:hypothetical protein
MELANVLDHSQRAGVKHQESGSLEFVSALYNFLALKRG